MKMRMFKILATIIAVSIIGVIMLETMFVLNVGITFFGAAMFMTGWMAHLIVNAVMAANTGNDSDDVA